MLENFKINIAEIDKIGKFSKKEKEFRIKNLDFFNKKGLPNKKDEDWKFSDLRRILSKNFNKFNLKIESSKNENFELIKDFDHNYIMIIDGKLSSTNFQFEEKKNIKIKNFFNEDFNNKRESNPMVHLNNALSNNGYFLEITDNYKFKKVLIIYNIFTKNLNDNILNIRNRIKVGKNSELHTFEIEINKSKKNFFNNTYETIDLEESAVFKNICIHNGKSSGFFHKFKKNRLFSNSKFSSFIFPSGPKFNKLDLEFNLEGKNSECSLRGASYIDQNDHQEIKTRINHLSPNCKSFQKVKKVLNSEGKGIFQGKIFVKDVAQKTDAYQLSKAILLSENSEFDSKPELEIYADDVKCSHGSSSGSIDEDSIHYLMSRGLNRKEAIKLLVNGFLNEVIDSIKSNSLRKYIQEKFEKGFYEHKKH